MKPGDRRGLEFSWLYSENGFEFAGIGAGAAFDAFALVNHVDLFASASDGFHGADFGTGGASLATDRVDARLSQRPALAGGAMLVKYVRVVFVTEIPQRGEHRVRSRLAQTTKRPL